MINGIGKKWKLKSSAPEDFLAEWPEYSPLVMTLLRHRNILTQEAVDKFFNPEYSLDLYDPYLLKNMDKMVKRLQKAINDEEKVVVYGDYDADGVSGAMILEIVLREAGCKNLSVYIPDRSREGYGLNEKAVEEISKGGNQLIITVDCGITDCKETKMAQDLGMEVVITDHHLPLGDLPPTKIIVDPWQKGDKYPFKSLSGAGVAFKVAQALIKKIGNFQIGFDKWLLDLVALSTIADYMPMVDENRTLVKYGLFVLAQARRPGIKALMKVSRVEPEMDRVNLATNLDTRTIAFTLVPRINAASRMDHANTSYDLLKIEDMEQARVLAKKIDGLNRNRQKRVEEIMQEADARYSANPKEIIFAGDESWPKGLLGLIASKLSEKYYRPAFIFNIENGTSKGSARGVEEFNVVSAMTECAKVIKVFNEYGGHAKAGGFSIKSEGIKDFEECLSSIARREFVGKDLSPSLEIDAKITPQEINWDNLESIQKFAPFGPENLEPIFLMENLVVKEKKLVGKNNQHLRLSLSQKNNLQNKVFKAIGFGFGDVFNKLLDESLVDLVFYIEADTWNGARALQLKIVDIKIK